jgi:predicted DsbA family dithiol-disulfide isomerase
MMQIEIWSDVICPWCYIGKRRFEQALALSGHRENINVTWRSFELDPDAPPQYPGTLEDLLARKYGVNRHQAGEMNARVTRIAWEVGLEYRLADARPGNTFDAHRLLHFAAARQLGDRAAERIMHAYFCEALPVGNPAALARLAPEFGIAAGDAQALLESDDYAEAVRADEARAAKFGITGVPFFVFDGKSGISGAQPVEVFAQELHRALAIS